MLVKNKTIFSLLLIVLTINMTGCVGALKIKPKPQEIKLNKTEQIREKKVTFNFPRVDGLSGEKVVFNFSELLSSKYNRSLMGMKYNLQQDEFKYEVRELTKYQYGPIKNSKDRGGLQLEFQENKILFSYEKGRWVGNSSFYTTSVFILNYKQVSPNEVVFTLPQQYQHTVGKALITETKPLDTKENIEADFLNIFNKLDKIVLTLSQKYKLAGEININYPEKSVYANFQRKLGLYSTSESKKLASLKNTFNLNLDDKNYPLNIEVYPYKNGSKIVYNTTIEYDISSKGEYTLTKQKIDDLHNMIKEIAND